KAMGEGCADAYRKIRDTYNLFDLSSRPVLLDMIVKSLPEIQKGKEKFNVVHLYEVYTFSWFEREDHRLQITKKGKEELVEALAYKLWQEGKGSIHYSELFDVLSEHLKEQIKSRRELEIADTEVRTASFLVRDEEGNYSFAHKSFQEFFIARKLKKDFLQGRYDALDVKRLSVEIIFFLRHLFEDEKELIGPMAGLLAGEYRENISENALLLVYTVLKMGFLKDRFSLNEEAAFSADETVPFRERMREHLPGKMNLRGASLTGLTMPGAFFSGDFTGAVLDGAVLTNALFLDVTFEHTRMPGVDFSGSVFKKVRFEKAAGGGCFYRRSLFKNCVLRDSDFGLSNFMDTVFENCRVEGNDLTGAGFRRSTIDMVELTEKENRVYGLGRPGAPGMDIAALAPSPDLGHSGSVRSVAMTGDGRLIVSAGDDNTVKLWETRSGRIIKTFTGHKGEVNSVAFSPDNRRVVSGSYDQTVKLWDVESGGLLTTFEGHERGVNSVGFSPNNRRVVSGSYDQTVKLWDVADVQSGGLLTTFKGHKERVWSVSFSPDNSRVVSGSYDNTVKLWDVESGGLLTTFEGHTDVVMSVSFSPDNRR
ncbi:MAG: hypothetical protein GY950_36740, partial [bacterium]|nr:hypothetical protein [bacterium]